MMSSESFGFFGGIFRSPVCWIACSNRLLPVSPGTIAGPVSPPLRIPASVSKSRSPFTFFAVAEWHSKQFFSRTGWILSRKKREPSSETAGSAATTARHARNGKNPEKHLTRETARITNRDANISPVRARKVNPQQQTKPLIDGELLPPVARTFLGAWVWDRDQELIQ